MPLLTNNDATYPDDPERPGVKLHQADHDALHEFFNQWAEIAPANGEVPVWDASTSSWVAGVAITVSPTAPTAPAVDDIWIDTSP